MFYAIFLFSLYIRFSLSELGHSELASRVVEDFDLADIILKFGLKFNDFAVDFIDLLLEVVLD
jgi:hypothetical protein